MEKQVNKIEDLMEMDGVESREEGQPANSKNIQARWMDGEGSSSAPSW
jgi:hypothetical protein